MQITLHSFYDAATETYAVLKPGLDPADYECEGESVTWVIDSNKSNALTLKETADKAAQFAFRFSDGTYNQTAFNKAYGIAFACVHCTGYKRGNSVHPPIRWEDVVQAKPETAWQYPLLDDEVLNEYIRRATTFLLPVTAKPKPEKQESTGKGSTATKS